MNDVVNSPKEPFVAEKLKQMYVPKMSVVILNQNTSISDLHFLPKSLKEVKISEIDLKSDFENSFCKGNIKLVGPCISSHRRNSKKIVIEELVDTNTSKTRAPSENESISVFLTGDSVSQCRTLKSDDIVFITGCNVDDAPSKSNKHSYELTLELSKKTRSRIWIIPSKKLGTFFENSFDMLSNKRTAVQAGSVASTSTSPAVAAKKRRPDSTNDPKEPEYTYTKLSEIKADMKPNVYGVVSYFKGPSLTRTGEYCCSLILKAQTCEKKTALKCVLFAKDVKSLPAIHSVGDIVRFHRLKIDVYRGELQARNIRGFSWLVFDSHPSSPEEPRSSNLSYTFTDIDRKIVKELKEWVATQTELISTRCTLANILPNNKYINIYGQIVCVMNENTRYSIITVWDGTTPQCRSSPPSRNVPCDEVERLADDIMAKTHTLALDVVLYDEHAEQNLKPGQFVFLRNVHAKAFTRNVQFENNQTSGHKPFVELIIHSGRQHDRGVHILQNSDPSVCQVKDRIQKLQGSDSVVHDTESFTSNLTHNPTGLQQEQAQEVPDQTIPEGETSDENRLENSSRRQTISSSNLPQISDTSKGASNQDIPRNVIVKEPSRMIRQSGILKSSSKQVTPIKTSKRFSEVQDDLEIPSKRLSEVSSVSKEAASTSLEIGDPEKINTTEVSRCADHSHDKQGKESTSGEKVSTSDKPISATPYPKLLSCCTITKFPDTPFTQIEEILNFGVVPYKFHCRAQVLFHLPESVEKCIKLGCQSCGKTFHADELRKTTREKQEGSMSSCDNYMTEEETDARKTDSSQSDYMTAPEDFQTNVKEVKSKRIQKQLYKSSKGEPLLKDLIIKLDDCLDRCLKDLDYLPNMNKGGFICERTCSNLRKVHGDVPLRLKYLKTCVETERQCEKDIDSEFDRCSEIIESSQPDAEPSEDEVILHPLLLELYDCDQTTNGDNKRSENPTSKEEIKPTSSRTQCPGDANKEPDSSQTECLYCPDCKGALKWTYLFMLVLDDGSALLNCLLFGKDAENFFFDILPEDVLFNESLVQTLEHRFNFMVGETEEKTYKEKMRSIQVRPWMDCCIASYKDKDGNVCFSIFGTRFLPVTME